MKKAIYILICLIWFSCANERKNKSESVAYEMEAVSKTKDEVSLDLSPINYEHIAAQKLIDYFDLLSLKQEHPEFEKDIVLQLQSFSKNSERMISYEKIDSIKNIRQVGSVFKASDSVQKMCLYFDVFSNNIRKTDSILAIIAVSSVMMDDVMVQTNKVSFQKIDPSQK